MDVAVIDLSQIKSDDLAGHPKAGTSPEGIAFVCRICESCIGIIDDAQEVGIPEQGRVLI